MRRLCATLGLNTTSGLGDNTGARQYCDDNNWKYRHWADMTGCEDEAVIVLDFLWPESISRPHKLLVVVTTAGAE